MKYKKRETRNVETRKVIAYYDRSRGSYCLILEDVDTQERVFTLPIYTNEPYRLEDPRVRDQKGNYVKRGVLQRMDGQQGMLFKKFIPHNGRISIFNYQIRGTHKLAGRSGIGGGSGYRIIQIPVGQFTYFKKGMKK